MKFELQEHIGKYPIVREIGSGATSRVYHARDPFAERDVAVKVFLFTEQVDPHTERMMHKAFLAEASLAGKLNHPHIVDIYDAVAEPDHSYLVMEYVAGTTLEAHSEVNNLLPLGKVVEIIFKCIRALEYAFQHGVIHPTSSPATSCSPRAARPRSATSAPRSSSATAWRARRSPASARPPTCRPSRCAWKRSTTRPTSIRSAW